MRRKFPDPTFDLKCTGISQQSQALDSSNLSLIQHRQSFPSWPLNCSYVVVIETSCDSPVHTRDQISLFFGQDHGYPVFAPRIDNVPSSRFERCFTNDIEIIGPCAYRACYAYLHRSGPDGWKPKTVDIYLSDTPFGVSFTFNTFIPRDSWDGFDVFSTATSELLRGI